MSSAYYAGMRKGRASAQFAKRQAGLRARTMARKHRPLSRKDVKRIVKGMAEKKFYTTQSNNTYDFSGSFIRLAEIAEGSGVDQREGDTIEVNRVDLHFQVAKADTNNTVRFIVFSKETNVQPTSATEILESTSQYAIISEYQQERLYSFKVLYDKCVTVNADKEVSPVYNVSIPMKIKCKFSGATSISAGSRDLWLLIISDSGAATHPSVLLRTNTKFTDL